MLMIILALPVHSFTDSVSMVPLSVLRKYQSSKKLAKTQASWRECCSLMYIYGFLVARRGYLVNSSFQVLVGVRNYWFTVSFYLQSWMGFFVNGGRGVSLLKKSFLKQCIFSFKAVCIGSTPYWTRILNPNTLPSVVNLAHMFQWGHRLIHKMGRGRGTPKLKGNQTKKASQALSIWIIEWNKKLLIQCSFYWISHPVKSLLHCHTKSQRHGLSVAICVQESIVDHLILYSAILHSRADTALLLQLILNEWQ